MFILLVRGYPIQAWHIKTSTEMNKTQLIEGVAAKSGLTKSEAKKSVEAIVEVVKESLRSGGSITLAGFGTFVVQRKQMRMGRNPRNGAPIRIPAKNVVKFRPGNILNDEIQYIALGRISERHE